MKTKSQPKPKKKMETTPVRVALPQLDALRKIGEIEDRSISWLIRFACDLLIDEYAKDPVIMRHHHPS